MARQSERLQGGGKRKKKGKLKLTACSPQATASLFFKISVTASSLCGRAGSECLQASPCSGVYRNTLSCRPMNARADMPINTKKAIVCIFVISAFTFARRAL